MSVVNTELSLKVKRVMLMIFSIDFVWYKCNTFILRCFLQFTCTNLDGSQKKGGNFLNLLQKEGVRRKGVGVPTEKGGFQPWRKLWSLNKSAIYIPPVSCSFKMFSLHLNPWVCQFEILDGVEGILTRKYYSLVSGGGGGWNPLWLWTCIYQLGESL